MKVLNLYAGIGGNRKLWEDVEVTAVELDPEIAKIYQDYFPNDKVIVADAHQYLLDHFKEFDFIWSSPPCPTHSKMYYAFGFHGHGYSAKYPDAKLFQEIIFLKYFFEGIYCIENVAPYYESILSQDYKKYGRHIFWMNFTTGNAKFHSNGGIAGHNKNPKRDIKERNALDSDLGLYILNCARNIITKQNEKQIDIKF